MAERQKKIARILKIQTQIHQAAEWKLAQLRRREEELVAEQADIIEALNADDALQGLFIGATSRRLTRLAGEAERVGREGDAQEGRVVAEARRMKTTERFSKTMEAEARRNDEKRLFSTILDTIGRKNGASPR